MRFLLCVLLGVWLTSSEPLAVLDWLYGMGGESHVFPLMDFIASDSEEIDHMVDQVEASLAGPCGAAGCAAVRHAAALAQRLLAPTVTGDAEEATLVDWLLKLNWRQLLGWHEDQASADAAQLVDLLVELSSAGADREPSSPRQTCDSFNSEVDENYVGALLRSLDGEETLPLEQNEFKWADFFGRHLHGKQICVLSVANLFLVAADVTAFAAAAAGGEHEMRVRRAMLFAQGIARQHVELAPPQEQEQRRMDLLRSRWPLWRMMQSIRKELAAGRRAALPPPEAQPTAARPGEDEEDLYLSIIVQCRNDDYGGNMLLRLNRMLATATKMLHSANLPSEIIVVEWNPPLSDLPIHEVIDREKDTWNVPIRVIRVPTAVHMKMPHHKAHPIFEHTAENVAFRRARGKFILKTNIDNILSPDAVLFMARRQLREDVVYRATYMEYDVTRPETEGMGPEELLAWLFGRADLLTNVNLQLKELSERYPEDTDVCLHGHDNAWEEAAPVPPRPFYWAGSGDFVLASRRVILGVRGYPEVAQNWQTDDLIHCRLRAAGVRQVVLQPPCITLHQNHRRINRVRASTRWVVTDSNFKDVCDNPFRPLPTEIGLDGSWGFAEHDFEEVLV